MALLGRCGLLEAQESPARRPTLLPKPNQALLKALLVDLARCGSQAKPQVSGEVRVAPPVGFEPTPPPPEGGALSPELRGPGQAVKAYMTSPGR